MTEEEFNIKSNIVIKLFESLYKLNVDRRIDRSWVKGEIILSDTFWPEFIDH